MSKQDKTLKSNKAIKCRIYPTKEQQILLAKTFGCCRKVWNLMLNDKIEHYKKHKVMLKNTPAQYKKDYPYLKEVDSLALANVQMHLERSYKNFFDKISKYPKYKSAKTCRKSYTTNNVNNSIRIEGNYIKLPKLGLVKIKFHRQPEPGWLIKSATISQDPDGRYFVSILFEFDKTITKITDYDEVVGFDYKSDGLYTDSNGTTCGSPKYYRKSQKRLAKLQKQLSKKQKGSKNRDKARNKVSRMHKHISNQRLDFLHKKSTEIANQYDVVCVEDLNMKSLSNKGFGNGKATLDNGYGKFINMLEYKLNDRGKYLIRVDKLYPSSQICNCCGKQHKEMKDLSIRTFICECGYKNDRDVNAALNIKQEGLRMLSL
jgi:putative transposase